MLDVLSQIVHGISKFDLYFCLFIFVILFLVYINRFPSVESIRRFTSMLDDRGGNILVLGALTVWLICMTVRMFYFAIGQIADKHITPDNAILLMALNTVSGTFAGTCFGALIKTMNGSMTVAPPNATNLGGNPMQPYPSLASPAGVVEAHISADIGGGKLTHA